LSENQPCAGDQQDDRQETFYDHVRKPAAAKMGTGSAANDNGHRQGERERGKLPGVGEIAEEAGSRAQEDEEGGNG
jgi:hypothetical protein